MTNLASLEMTNPNHLQTLKETLIRHSSFVIRHSSLVILQVTMFAPANDTSDSLMRSLEALRLQPRGKPPQCFSWFLT